MQQALLALPAPLVLLAQEVPELLVPLVQRELLVLVDLELLVLPVLLVQPVRMA